jgi:hypothetical protein
MEEREGGRVVEIGVQFEPRLLYDLSWTPPLLITTAISAT